MIPLTRAQHILLFLVGACLQSLSAIDVPWIAPYRAAFLGLAGTLLWLSKSTSVLGLMPDRRQQGALVPALMEPDPTAPAPLDEPATEPGVKPPSIGDPPDRRKP